MKSKSNYQLTFKRYLPAAILLTVLSANVNAGDEELEKFGDTMQFALPLAAWGATFAQHDKAGRIQFYKHLGTAAGIATVAKFVYRKTRPNASDSKTSFPSGHTNGAFIGATFLNTRYGPKWGIPAYTAAVITAYSRVDAEAHHLDDVIAGASVAYFSNLYWVTPFQSNITIAPMVMSDGVGLTLTLNEGKSKSRPLSPVTNKDPKFRYSLGFGPAYMKKNEFTAPTVGGDTFDLYNFERTTDPHTTAVPMFEWFINDKNTVAFSLAPYEARDFGEFTQPTNFAGETFPANTRMRSAYRMYEFTMSYDYEVYNDGKLGIQLGPALAYSRTVLELATVEGPEIYASVDDKIWLPLIHTLIEYNFTRKWSIFLDVEGISTSTDKQIDGGVGFTYQFDPHWDASFGVVHFERDIETTKLTNHSEYDILALSVGYTFF